MASVAICVQGFSIEITKDGPDVTGSAREGDRLPVFHPLVRYYPWFFRLADAAQASED